jgi:beta-lactamase superfamily II metal-dependent hydrolase
MDKLRVRAYNVRFGDAILVSVPDKTAGGAPKLRHILIDVGNALGGGNQGGLDTVFEPVIKNILEVLDGEPLDLYIMTHEHMDHVQGLLYAANQRKEKMNTVLKDELKVTYAWLTASADPEYYDNYEDAEKEKKKETKAFADIGRYLQASEKLAPTTPENAWFRALMHNNNTLETADYIDYLRGLAPKNKTFYVHRETKLKGKHPFREAKLSIWAPEADTSIYYGRFKPMALNVSSGDGAAATPSLTAPIPPPGVDAGAFYQLVEARQNGYVENLLAIDKAKNNTSLVFCLEWRQWKLLFSGDAEERSWKEMNKQEVLQPVHFLKISHHGSHNGTPAIDLIEKIMPKNPSDRRKRSALVSTCEKTYGGIPHGETIDLLKTRCEVNSTEPLENGAFLDIEFEG